MNIDDHVAEWSGLTDGEVANAIFSSYGFTPADGNTDHDSPSHTPDGHTLFQRATDLQFLRGLARRGGKLCRVACTDTPGVRTGYFVVPSVDGPPVGDDLPAGPRQLDGRDPRLRLGRHAPDRGGREPGRPHPVLGRTGTDVSTGASGLAPLDQRDYPTYLGQSSTLLLTAPADVPELSQRTAAVLDRVRVLRPLHRGSGRGPDRHHPAGRGCGDDRGRRQLQSGNWLVWNVRHSFSLDSWKMAFTLVRNAMGPAGPGGALASLARAAQLSRRGRSSL